DELVGAAQGRIGQTRIAPAASGPGPLLLVAREIEVAPQGPEVGADLDGPVQHALRRHGVAYDRGLAGAQDAGLFAADALAVVAQIVHVIQRDAGDHRAVGIDDIDRIEPPAKTYFED